ncbi:MAG TPA: DUF2141 domain-containing protein [Caulobacteraceae bacterium]|jgi:uncharacterized protein (DUF2141 family)|nr:DUF2141 domain-containing protein [Caulobacteraceae bacterium]
MSCFKVIAVASACACLLAAPALAQTCMGQPTGTKLDIVVDGVRSDQGLMTVTVYPPESGKFLKANGEIGVWRMPSQTPSTEMCVWVPAPGPYAVAVYDDLNENLRFDHSLVAPLEPYGFSNNPRLILGPPSARAAKIDVAEGETTIHIQLRYPGSAGADQGKAVGQ